MLSCESVCPCVSLCVSLTKGRVLSFVEHHRKHHVGKEWRILYRNLSRLYKVLSHWLQLTPQTQKTNRTANIIAYQATSICSLQSFIRLLLTYLLHPVFIIVTYRHTCITLGQGQERVHNLKLKLCSSLGCKQVINCYTVVFKAG